MKKKLLSTLKILIFLALGVFLVWVSIKDITPEQKLLIKESFSKANYFWVVISMIMGILSHVSRAARWNILFEPLGHTPKFLNAFFAVLIGYFANFAAPRAGEVLRCGILNKYEKIPLTQSIGTVIAERLIDVLCLGVLFFLMLATQYDTIIGLSNKWVIQPFMAKMNGLMGNTSLMLVAIFTFLTIVGLLFIFRKKLKSKFFLKSKELAYGFWQGMKTVKDIKRPGAFMLHTINIWLMYFLMLYICFYCFPETSNLSLGDCLAILILGSLGIILVPGGIGLYQILVSETLITFGIASPVALAFAWIVWSSQFLLLMFTGVTSLIGIAVYNKNTDGSKK